MKNKILLTITGVAVAVAVITACAIDTNHLTITIPCLVSIGWIGLFVKANRHYFDR